MQDQLDKERFHLVAEEEKIGISFATIAARQIERPFSNSGKLGRVLICPEAQWAGGKCDIDEIVNLWRAVGQPNLENLRP